MRFAKTLPGFLLAFLASGHAEADEGHCFPTCRSGYVCTPEGKCVSECNPPCDNGTMCKAGACVTPTSSADAAAPVETKKLEMVWAGGLGVHVSTVTAPVILTSFSMAYGGDHAFIAGIQGGVAFFSTFVGGATIGEVGLNVGYRGIFTKGDVGVGMLAVVQPQVWVGGYDALFGLGGAVGGVLTYKRLVIEVPLSVTRVAVVDDWFHTNQKAVVFTPAALAGVSF